MADNITFNDVEVEVEIFDAVLGKLTQTDFNETDSTKINFLRGREKLALKEDLELKQDKLTAGLNISIEENESTGDLVISSAIDEEELGDIIEEKVTEFMSETFATIFEPKEVDDVEANGDVISEATVLAVSELQMHITFKTVEEVMPNNTPILLMRILEEEVLPKLPNRFGQVWDPLTYECVGFCKLTNDGELTVNAVSKFMEGGEYVILV